jgi:outer membrane receptor protein involved in Fe transport
VTATATGQFAETNLPAARCSVTATSESFEPESIVVDSRTAASLTLMLQVRKFASEVIVTPTRGLQAAAFEGPEPASVVSRRDIDSRPFTLLAQVLREEPGILLQQTTSAQTSPVIRGFTGQSNVYLIDGVRLNTGAWRSGPSQYTAWIEPGVVDSIEVVRGSGSVQYGSDALGGAIQFLSAPARFGVAPRLHGTVELTGTTADKTVAGLAEIAVRYPALAVRGGGSRRSVGDLRAGDGIDSHAAVTRFLGLPSTILSSRQLDTSYEQAGAYVVGDGSPRPGSILHGLVMHEDQSGASRYDRIYGGQGLYRSGFDPQTLDFGLLRFSSVATTVLNGGVSGTFSVNRQADGRFEQSRPTTRLDRQSSTTTALGYQLQANHDFSSRFRLLAGTEFYDESISASRELVEIDGRSHAARPDIPDGTTYTNLGVFAQQTADLLADRLRVSGGIRFSSFGFSSREDASLGVIEDDVTMRSTTFQAAAVVTVTDGLNVTANVSRAFRAANASDLGGIGLSGGGGFEITAASAAALGALVGSGSGSGAVSTGERVSATLQPEIVYLYDVGARLRLGPVGVSVTGFDMELFDFLQRRALVFETNVVGTVLSGFEIVRQDAAGLAYIAQDIRPIATSVNVDRGRVVGFDAEGELRLPASWTARAYFSLANGRTLPDGEFARRMTPPMGGTSIRWTGDRIWAEGVVTFAADQTRLNSGDLSDARIGGLRTRGSIATYFNQNATDLGLVRNGVLLATGETLAEVQTRVLGEASSAPLFSHHPGFVTLGARAGMRLSPGIDVTALLDNLGDVNYRLYGSGVDAPGFNVQLQTRFRF